MSGYGGCLSVPPPPPTATPNEVDGRPDNSSQSGRGSWDSMATGSCRADVGKCVSVMAAHWQVVWRGVVSWRPVLLQRPRVGRLCGALIQLRGRGPGPCAGGAARFSAARLVQLGAVAVGIITQGAILWRGSGKLLSRKGPLLPYLGSL